MKNSKLTLLETIQGNFRLSIDTIYEKEKEDGSTQQYVYINPKNNNGVFKPSVFLVFAYVDPVTPSTKQSFYASIPHMWRLREAFGMMTDMLNDPNAFVDVNGTTTVSPNFADPIVIEQSSGKWMSLTLTTYKDSNGLATQVGVAIQNSESNGFSSLLTANEFRSVADIVLHLDFAAIEGQAVIMELLSRNQAHTASKPMPQYNTYNANMQKPQGQYKQYVTQQPVRQAQMQYDPQYYNTYSNGGQGIPTFSNNRQSAQENLQEVAMPQPIQQRAGKTNEQPTQGDLTPRKQSSPKINMDAIRDIEIEEIELDDSATVASIFED